MDWNDIRFFLSVAENGTLSAAAKALNVSQPTVGRRMDALEQVVGRRLFERSQQGFSLTAAGEILLPHALRMQAEALSFLKHPGGAEDDLSGPVRIRLGELTSRFFASHLHEFRARYPKIQIELETSYELADLSRKEVDIAMVDTLPGHGDITVKKLAHYTHAVYGARSYVAEHPEAFTEDRYSKCDWITAEVRGDCGADHAWVMGKIGPNRPSVTCRTFNGLFAALEGGAGLAVCSIFSLEDNPNVVRVSEKVEELSFEAWLVAHRDLLALPRVRVLWDWLVGLFEVHRGAFENFREELRDVAV
ncbi:LysR family transcriptional regulator [Aestuariispira insulae]|uniref:DNA-binding transcriptional LysR family regulator n=1 Tax=Aestuariispira insulae TaxID=1461337 RepID=A0A3D9H9Q0_9PROT|nr:LysR family transcriptional regulator [Aestuariispira insulae]RED46212.1 DNA-binding transcriptional LysR family regulator [Aestuariispira insulae]